MSIVEFAEEILGFKLLSFQKEFLTKCYEAYSSTSNKQLHYIPVRGRDIKWMSFILQYIVMLYYSEYSSENEVKEGLDDKFKD